MSQFYGGFLGNTAGMQMAGNPFGADFVIPQQRRQAPVGGPQLNPLQQAPARVFPKDQPGREGAIDIQFRQANLMPGMIPMGNAGFFMGPQYGQQLPAGYFKTVS
jgi:hypothetical protein